MADLADIARVSRLSAALRAAANIEADETIAALRVATAKVAEHTGQPAPTRFLFGDEHIRALVVSAFNAGALYECRRRDGDLSALPSLTTETEGQAQ